jgi:hypothetical protein
MNTSPRIGPFWRSFENIKSGAEGACAASACAFSLATLEIAWCRGGLGFALIERKEQDVWRWAVVGEGGFLAEEGFEATQLQAKNAAAEALEHLSERLVPRAI